MTAAVHTVQIVPRNESDNPASLLVEYEVRCSCGWVSRGAANYCGAEARRDRHLAAEAA